MNRRGGKGRERKEGQSLVRLEQRKLLISRFAVGQLSCQEEKREEE